MKTRIRVTVAGARSSAVGPDDGVSPQEYRDLGPRIEAAHAQLLADRRTKRSGFFDVYKDEKAVARTKKEAARFSKSSPRNLVILGIGGSALGTSTLAQALLPPHYNLLSDTQRAVRPRLFVEDNVDPRSFRALMDLCDPAETVYNVISKSGGTAETLSQAVAVIEQIRSALGTDAVRERVLITSDPKKRNKSLPPLLALGEKFGIRHLPMQASVGGRFSVFTPVGLFPAAMVGIDIEALLAGCAAMDARCATTDLKQNPAYARAVTQFALNTRHGKTMSVLMPYSDGLSLVSDWYRQLWAESLGKSLTCEGETVRYGQTPIKALGVTDQHSQLQLYLEGPNDKSITVIDAGDRGNPLTLSSSVLPKGQAKYLAGKSMRDLFKAECQATIGALREARRPVMTIRVSTLDAFAMGELLQMFMLETAMTAALLGINAYDQPAVERIKVLTRKLLGET